jgi:hypothetical protein
VKDMDAGTQETVPAEQVLTIIRGRKS